MHNHDRKVNATSIKPLPSRQARTRWELKQDQMKRLWFDSWFIEIFALSLCIASAISICVVLVVFDNRPLPPLPRTLTMNAIVAFLSTIAKSALLLVVSSCISQLKWTWYQKERSLADTQLFEDASRGPLGSLQMLFQHRTRSTACIGASILILALLFEPFVQQVLTYPNVITFTPSDSAVTKKARKFFGDRINNTKALFPLRKAVVSGIWFEEFEPTPLCPVGECQWETYRSVGYCSSCGPANPQPKMDCSFDFSGPVQNTVGQMERDWVDDYRVCNITFRQNVVHSVHINATIPGNESNGYDWSIQSPLFRMFPLFEVNMDWNINQYPSETIQGVHIPFYAFNLVHFELTNTSLAITKAEECTLHFCLQNYTPMVTNGTSQTIRSNTHAGSGMFASNVSDSEKPGNELPAVVCWTPSEKDNVDPGFAPRFSENTNLEVYSDNFSLCSTPSYLEVLKNTLVDPFWGHLSQNIYGSCSSRIGCEWTNEPAALEYSLEYDEKYDTDLGSGVLDPVYRMYTAGAGAVMRNIASSLTLVTINTDPTIITGQVGKVTTLVRVRWAWLILPLVLILASVGLFAWTAFENKQHRLPLWKSSVLALLFHGLQRQLIEEHQEVGLVSLMEAKADHLKVSLKYVETEGVTLFTERNSSQSSTSVKPLPRRVHPATNAVHP